MTTMTVDLAGYQIGQILYTGTRTVVYRGVRQCDNLPVVIKLLRNEYPNFRELLQFRNQYTIAKNLNAPGIIRTVSLEHYNNGYALVMEDFGGISLPEWQHKSPVALEDFFPLALSLCDSLEVLGGCRIIHKDIKPANILINPETKQVKLIDFSIATLLPRETQTPIAPNVLEGTLAYISPEQTGRMNRGIDYRTDFYSLGVTFYQLLTAKLPFECSDPLELVHSHIAKAPPPPSNYSEIPPVVEEIVLKLMAKNAEERYQSALGLKHDLQQCYSLWSSAGKSEAFELGKRDISNRFTIPEKLYGREKEVAALLQAFARVAGTSENEKNPESKPTNPNSEIMLVAGFSGIGKTAVINEVHKPIARQKGYFISGKFDQFNRNLPLSAFVQAFRDLMGQLLSESEAQLSQWRSKILSAVGDSGQVLIEVMPELECAIGSQPPVPELSGAAAQNRFNLLFQKFIAVFSTKEHPLVIFLDDLQWADSASLKLMKLLMEDRIHLLLLGAYRDNEVYPAHPFILTVEELKKSGKTVNTIILSPLSLGDSNQLVADTLHCSIDRSQLLTELIERQTKGNPFFLTQFLKALYEEEHIIFNRDGGYWEGDLAQINARSLTDDVVEFMAGQLQKLPSETQEVLKLAACIGSQFELETLAIVSQQSQTDAAVALWTALQEGLIIPQTYVYKFYLSVKQELPADQPENAQYRFLHDRVQQAAYCLIPEGQKQTTHYQIGQLLLQKISAAARQERIFELVNQLNYGTSLIAEQTERDELAQLNLSACRKARSATAYQTGREYAAIGLSLLGKYPWQRQYQMSLAFHELAAELALLCGDFEAMEYLIETVLDRAQTLLDRVEVYRTKIIANFSQNKLSEAIDIAQQLLHQLGVNFPKTPTPADFQQIITEIKELIGEREIKDLIDLPEMTDGEKIAIVQIVTRIIPAAHISGSPLFPLFVALPVKLSIQYGNISRSAFGYVAYGMLTCNLLQDVDAGVQFGQLALQLVSKLDAKAVKPEVLFVAGLFLLHRKSHTKEMLPLLREGYVAALEVGNLEFVGYIAHLFCLNSFWCGQPLETLEQETRAYTNALMQFNQVPTANWCRIYWQPILNLLGAAAHPCILSGEALQEAEAVPRMIEAQDLHSLCYFHLYKLMLCYLFAEIESAREQAVEVKRYLIAGYGMVGEPAYYLYDSLTALAALLYPSPEASEALQRVEENQTQLQEHWARYAPMNHQHKVDLVAAEKCRVLGQNYEAGDWYDRAIAGAKANGYIQEEALANELAAKFYLAWGKEKVAAGYMQEAYYCWARWGAKAKIDRLEEQYPNLLHPILQGTQTLNPLETLASLGTASVSLQTSTSTRSTSSINTAFDFAALLRASQVISSTIQLDELICQLTQIILQNSGGDRCLLIQPNLQGEWQLQALATPETTQLYSQSLQQKSDVPFKLIHYVKNTQQVVVIDALKTALPVIDDYLSQREPQSVLCMPILNKAQLVAILYLENGSTSNVFTNDRLLVLNFLCTQAAISLENARLYQQAQQALQDLKNAQLQIVQSEKMSALGNLVAGVAHEINNPVGCIGGNLQPAQDYIRDLFGLIELYQDKYPQLDGDIEDEIEAIELDYIREDLPKLIGSMKLSVERIAHISTSLRTFSRTDKDYKVPFNLHEGLDSTLLILKHRLKANEQRPAIEVVKNYGSLPEVECFPGQLNQVFMNILANAIDALDEANVGRSFAEIQANPNRITLSTKIVDGQVNIAIGDNGLGMPEEVLNCIFQQGFTTKGVGKGTGLGLAIARQIVVEKHGGQLAVSSQKGQGTEFAISLPLECEGNSVVSSRSAMLFKS